MTEYKLDYVARPQFYDFHTRKQRWAVNVCHRRAGKALDIATPIPMVGRPGKHGIGLDSYHHSVVSQFELQQWGGKPKSTARL